MTFHSSFRSKRDKTTYPNELGPSFVVVVIVCAVLDLTLKIVKKVRVITVCLLEFL